MDEMLRVLVVADSVLARAGLVALLDEQAQCDVVGQTAPTAQLVDDVELFQPDVVLVDLGWQAKSVLRTLAPLASDEWPLIALLTDENDVTMVASSLVAFNTFGLLMNSVDPYLLGQALHMVNNGLIALDPNLTALLIGAATITPDPALDTLTPREDEVLQLLAQGLTNKSIAHQLGISEHTIKFHVNAIMTKLNAQSRTDAVVRATRAGLIIL